MNVTIPTELEQPLATRAARLGVSTEEMVRQALTWYLAIDEGLFAELEDWQAVRDEALDLVERPPT
jgi:hypothetical protein